jgi:FecR protein
MRCTSRLSRFALSGAAVVALSVAAHADPAVGTNAAIRNSVQTKATTEPALHPAVVRAPVHIGDVVVSGDKSALQILLVDQSVFTVGANARMTIDKFVYDPSRGSSDIAASVAKGAFRFMSGPSLAGAGRNAIASPVATIGVRGTIVEGAVGADALAILAGQPGLPALGGNSDSLTLIVLIGPGHHNEGFDKPGAIDVTAGGTTVSAERAGEAFVILGPGQPPIGPFYLSDANFARLSALLGTRAGDSGLGSTGLGDVGSAGANSGDTLDPGAIGESYAADTNGLDLPAAVPSRPVVVIGNGGDFFNGVP